MPFWVVESMRERLLRTIDEMRDEIIELTAEFVRIPTVNPPGENYPRFTEFYSKRAEEYGLEVEVIEVPEERMMALGLILPRTNILARLMGRRKRPVLHMNGHFDVVPPGSGWSVDPFGAEIKDGMLYGRGASDMKGGVAAQLMAAVALKRAGVELKGTLTISATCDEETGGQLGAGYIVDEGYAEADFGINSDSGPIDAISLGHRGALWVEITTLGRMTHGSTPHKGVNAVEKMAAVIQELAKLRERFKEKISKMPFADPKCRHPTITIGGTIQGGVKTNIVPDRCVMTIDRRVIYEEMLEEAESEIREVLEAIAERDPEFRYRMRVTNRVQPSYTPETSEVAEALKRSVREIVRREPKITYGCGFTDMWYFNLRMPMVHYGVNLPGQAHSVDEHVSIEDLITGTKVLALTSLNLLG